MLATFFAIPILPLLYFQSVRVRKKIPDLPEAVDPQGLIEKSDSRAINLAIIGESTMAGVGVDNHQVGFAGQVAKQLADHYPFTVRWKVIAKSGYTVQQIDHELLSNLQPLPTDLVVIGIGANDTFQANTPWKWIKQVDRMVTTIREKTGNCPILFTQFPPIPLFTAFTPLMRWLLGAHNRMLAKELSIYVKNYSHIYFIDEMLSFDSAAQEKNQMDRYFSDGVHPSALTYELWAKSVAEVITGEKLLPTAE